MFSTFKPFSTPPIINRFHKTIEDAKDALKQLKEAFPTKKFSRIRAAHLFKARYGLTMSDYRNSRRVPR